MARSQLTQEKKQQNKKTTATAAYDSE